MYLAPYTLVALLAHVACAPDGDIRAGRETRDVRHNVTTDSFKLMFDKENTNFSVPSPIFSLELNGSQSVLTDERRSKNETVFKRMKNDTIIHDGGTYDVYARTRKESLGDIRRALRSNGLNDSERPNNSYVSFNVEPINSHFLSSHTAKRSNETNSDKVVSYKSSEDADVTGYGSSIVLASDLLSLSSAVADIDDELCSQHGYRFLDGLIANKDWALKMFDASAKSPQGVLWGARYQLGNYDECVQVAEQQDHASVHGQYCLASIQWKKNVTSLLQRRRTGGGQQLRWAVCVPRACDVRAVRRFVVAVLANVANNNSDVQLSERDCSSDSPLVLFPLDVALLSLILVIGAIVILATCYDLLVYRRKAAKRHADGVPAELILSFSAARNLFKIISTKQNSDGLGLDAVAGIKALAMIFIVSGHTSLFAGSGPVTDSHIWDELLRDPLHAFMINSVLLVDTFLMLSAFLFCRLLLLELQRRRGRVNVLMLYIFRYTRVTPAYLVVILFYMTWLPKLYSGPLWRERMEREQARCIDNWWTNILYVNNYINAENMCMFQSWFLSVDTQMFVLAPALVYPLWARPRLGRTLLATATLVSACAPALFTYLYDYDPTLLVYAKEMNDITQNEYFNSVYVKTHMRAAAYLVGIVFGYLLHLMQEHKYEMSGQMKAWGWLCSCVLGASAIFSVTAFYQSETGWKSNTTGTRLASIAYAGFDRLAWCIATGWTLLACSAPGRGGFLGRMLRWKALVPLSRLTYCAYLVNGIVELSAAASLRSPIHITVPNLFGLSMAHTIETFILAFILCLTFESPIHGFEKIFLRHVGVKPREGSTQHMADEYEENSSGRSAEVGRSRDSHIGISGVARS